MGTPDEAVPAPTGVGSPSPDGTGEPSPLPTPAAVLAWVAAVGGQPWFPSRHAAETGTDRDALDEPLGQLRLAGLVRVATWVRGLGQGYVLTPEGEAAVASGRGIPAPGEEPEADLSDETPRAIAALPPLDPASVDRPASRLGLDTRAPILIPILLIANLLWFFAGLVAAIRGGYPVGRYLGDGHQHLLHRFGAVSGMDLFNDEWWRLMSACFVHIGVLHLLVNLFALGMMGPLAELLWGRWRLAAIYFVSGLAGSCLAMANRPDATLAGASGAIWGVLASLLAWLLLFRQYLPREVAADWARRLWIVFLLNGAVSLLPGISWEGHLGGGIAGFVAAGLLNAVRFGNRPRRLLAAACLLALPVACVVGLVATMNRSEAWAPLRQRHADAEALAARRAEAEAERGRITGVLAASEAYNRDVVPRLNRLNSDAVRAVERSATFLLLRTRDRRNPEAAAETWAKARELKSVADEAAALTAMSTGVEAFDRQREKARLFAEARSRSFRLLLGMLESPAVPDAAAWAAWGEARRAADALWEQLRQPR